MAFDGVKNKLHEHSDCCSTFATPSVHQSLSEIDFERGIWPAALCGDCEEIEKHLRKGVHVDSTDPSGYTALHYAARNGHLKVCEILLKAGANANIKTRSGDVSPLHRAAYKGHVDIMKLLIKYKADPKSQDSDGKTAMHKATEENHYEAVKLLVDLCPESANIRDYKGKLPSDYIKDDKSVIFSVFKTTDYSL